MQWCCGERYLGCSGVVVRGISGAVLSGAVACCVVYVACRVVYAACRVVYVGSI